MASVETYGSNKVPSTPKPINGRYNYYHDEDDSVTTGIYQCKVFVWSSNNQDGNVDIVIIHEF